MLENQELKIVAVEAWFKTMTKEEMEGSNNKPISEYEDKKECLVVSALTHDGQKESVAVEILRKEEGVDFGEPVLAQSLTGRFTEFFEMANLIPTSLGCFFSYC